MSLPALSRIIIPGFSSLLDIEGNVQKGLDEISEVAGYSGNDLTYSMFKTESLFYLAFLNSTLGKGPRSALQILQKFNDKDHSLLGKANPLLIFIKASILSKAGKTDEALQNLQEYHPVSQ
jgi:hypothetical protein